MAEGRRVLDVMARSYRSAEEFRAGWEGWLEGARLAQLRFDAEDDVRVGVLRAERNGFLVLAEEGDFPRTGPWHRDGWVIEFSRYYYFGRMVYMDPFDERFLDSSGFFSAYSVSKSRVAFDDQAGRYCCWLDAGDWWIFCRSFLLLEVPIEQSMEGFLGWVTGVVGDLLEWVVGVRSSVSDGAGSPPQVMGFASVFMRFLLVCGGSGVFPLSMAEKYWPSYCSPAGVRCDEGLAERLQRRFLSFMLCARNYLRLMWMDATWVGRDPVPRLGYVEWPLTGPAPFREVWRRVVNKGSLLDFLMHLVVGVPYDWSPSPSSWFPFKFYGSPPIVGSLGSFLTFAGYLCPYHSGVFRGGVGHLHYPGAEVYFEDCLDEWFRELMVGRLDCVASGGAAQRLFQLFGVHFHGEGRYFSMYPFGEWEFEDAGEIMLWGSLSGVSGDRFFDVDVARSLPL